MKISTFLSAISVLFFISCSAPQNETESNQTITETQTSEINTGYKTQDFKEPYKEFFSSIIDKDAVKFNHFINPEFGVYIIYAKGAMPQMLSVNDITEFKNPVDGSSFFELDPAKVGYELLDEELPKVDCDKSPEFYTKSGAFTQPVNEFQNDKIWEHADISKDAKNTVSQLANTISMTVLNTANYRYYFSNFNGKWYITFIDTRKPCQS